MLVKVFILAVTINACWAVPTTGKFRPCSLKDYKCIRDNLAANSNCKKNVVGSIPELYTVNDQRFETPYFNASYIDKVLIVRNHDKCVVSEFFVNLDKRTYVLSVDCRHLDLESNRTMVQHHSLGEDTEYNYHVRGEYPLVRLTVNLKHAEHADLCTGYVLGDVTELPIFKIDPLDKPTENFLSRDLSFLNIYERETFYYRARHLMKYFVNSIICDFECN